MKETKDLYNENYKWLKKKIEILGNGSHSVLKDQES